MDTHIHTRKHTDMQAKAISRNQLRACAAARAWFKKTVAKCLINHGFYTCILCLNIAFDIRLDLNRLYSID